MDRLYVHAVLKIRIGGYERFCEAMARQLPILEGYGWKLVGAWTTAVGRVCTVIDLWEIPDANAFFDVTAKWRAGPEFQAFRADLGGDGGGDDLHGHQGPLQSLTFQQRRRGPACVRSGQIRLATNTQSGWRRARLAKTLTMGANCRGCTWANC